MVFSRLSASAIVCSFNFDFLLRSFDLTFFCDAQCNLMTLFLDDKISLQASKEENFRSSDDQELIRKLINAIVQRDILRITCPSNVVLSFFFGRERSLSISAGSGLP